MNALKFTWEQWGSETYKTEVWKEGLDTTRFATKAMFEDSKGAISSLHGSQALQNNFESFLKFSTSGKRQEDPQPENNENIDEEAVEDPDSISPKTFRVVINNTPDNIEEEKSPLEYQDGESVIVYDITPSKLEFKSDIDEENENKIVTTDDNGMPFNPNDLYHLLSPDLKQKTLKEKDKNVNVSHIEDY